MLYEVIMFWSRPMLILANKTNTSLDDCEWEEWGVWYSNIDIRHNTNSFSGLHAPETVTVGYNVRNRLNLDESLPHYIQIVLEVLLEELLMEAHVQTIGT